MDKPYQPKIKAKDVEEFNKILKEVDTLPYSIKSQIDYIENTIMGVECHFKMSYEKELTLSIPTTTTQIQHLSDGIGIYAGKFFFKIGDELSKRAINYRLVPLEEKK